ncbi:MAG: sensor histidine kinase [Actinobacteria bacterium]|nr:sensor histidine kinase [Actinomycetota bacterium]
MEPGKVTPLFQRHAQAAFLVAVVLPTVGLGVYGISRHPETLRSELVVWALLIAIIELLPVPAWRGLSVSMGLPLLMAVAFVYAPVAAGATAFVGTSDPREFKREIRPLHALFNRSQVALSVFAASTLFHSLASLESSPSWRLIEAAMLASGADYLVNSGLVTVYMSIRTRLAPWKVIRELRIGRLSEFLVSYLGLGVLGLALAILFLQVEWWSVPTFVAPLLFARQMFFRSRALEEAHKELQEREQVLKSLSNAMAEERQDERAQIAGYLHDDLAQILFRLSIQVDVAKRLLEKGETKETFEQLEKIRQSKQDTSDRIRALIRDLHRSPLGPKGLREALGSFTEEMGRDSGVTFHTDVQEVALPAPIALLVYHIAREGVTNALKHARASNFWITVGETPDHIELQLRDDGVGFDAAAPGPEGHFGMAMMRERAQVGGGTFDVQSAPGAGTTITVRFPTSLLQAAPPTPDSTVPPTAGTGRAHASPGTSGASGPAAEGSRESVRA